MENPSNGVILNRYGNTHVVSLAERLVVCYVCKKMMQRDKEITPGLGSLTYPLWRGVDVYTVFRRLRLPILHTTHLSFIPPASPMKVRLDDSQVAVSFCLVQKISKDRS